MKLRSMNAWLKLGQYLRGHDALPTDEELQPHLRNIRAGERLAMAGVRGDDAIAPGARWDSLYWSRLNLSVSEAALLAADARDVADTELRVQHWFSMNATLKVAGRSDSNGSAGPTISTPAFSQDSHVRRKQEKHICH